MFVERIKTPGIAHNAYLLGSKGIGLLFDPRRDVDAYTRLAQQKKCSIEYVFETHRQEDFVLGSASLRSLLGAKRVGGAHELFRRADIRLGDGEQIEIGELLIRALSTPGHTPESVSYAVYRKDRPERCWAIFSGDALLIGETGRTDLPGEAKTAENAGLLFDSIHSKIRPLGDQTLIYPAHGAGSVCGGHIADYDESTIGFEKTYNKVFTLARDSFVQHKLRERLPRPPYFSHMEEVNLAGGMPLEKTASAIPVLQPPAFERQSKAGIVIDTRLPEAFAGSHIPGSCSIWLDGLPVFGGWTAAPDTPVFLILERPHDLKTAFLHLARIGIDNVAGVLAGNFESWRNAGLPIETSGVISPVQMQEREGTIALLDVREISEFEDDGHISNASHLYVGHLNRVLAGQGSLPFAKDKPLAVTCSVGHRASLAVSVLRQHGHEHVSNMLGGMTAWKNLNLPVTTGGASRQHEPDTGVGGTRVRHSIAG
jgi:hydroxyacylglutathione hydrolase